MENAGMRIQAIYVADLKLKPKKRVG